MIKNLGEADFDTAIHDSEKLVLIDFWADWCGPCKAFAPTLDDIADDYGREVDVAKVDIVANEALAERLGVRTVPLLLLMKGGEEIERVVGVLSRARLSALLEKHL